MDAHLHIGALIFPQMDQIDFTGPFEVLSRVPDSTFHVIWKEAAPIRDIHGLILTPEETFSDAPPLDLLVVPGGWGQELLMEDEAVLSFVRERAAHARHVFSVCTGALVCGAAGLLKGVRATTYWGAFPLLKDLGAIPVDARVVVDGKHVSTAGVTAGLDGRCGSRRCSGGTKSPARSSSASSTAPEPPFYSGSPATAPPEVLKAVEARIRAIGERRLATAQRVATRLGIVPIRRNKSGSLYEPKPTRVPDRRDPLPPVGSRRASRAKVGDLRLHQPLDLGDGGVGHLPHGSRSTGPGPRSACGPPAGFRGR